MASNMFVKSGLIVLVLAGVSAGALPLFMRDFSFLKKGNVATASVNEGSTKNSSPAVAGELGTVNNKIVLESELTSGEKYKVFQAQKQLFSAYEEILMRRFQNEFLENYRKEKKLPSTNAAMDEFVKSKVNVSDAEINSIATQYKDHPSFNGKNEEERKKIIRDALEGRQKQSAMMEVMMQAKNDGKVKISMTVPSEPKVDVDDGGNTFLGPKNAPVTIIEFADYQCPYCARMVPTLHELVKKFDGKVRWVYRDFPLKEIHPEALPSAVAANCAGAQGKYFEMHDKLMENHSSLSSSLYDKLAGELKLDLNKFKTCLKDPAMADEVNKDMNYGIEIGINGTPAYFVNGKRLPGVGDLQEFSRIVEEELAAVGSK